MRSEELFQGVFDHKRVKLLKLFANKPEEQFYLREAAKIVKVSPATTYRILNQLVDQDLLTINKIKKTKLYRLSVSAKAKAFANILEGKKTAIQEFVDFAKAQEGVQRIILHGKESKDKTNILIIGDEVNASPIKEKVGDVKSKYNISIVELTLTPDQFQQMAVMGLFPSQKKVLWSIKN